MTFGKIKFSAVCLILWLYNILRCLWHIFYINRPGSCFEFITWKCLHFMYMPYSIGSKTLCLLDFHNFCYKYNRFESNVAFCQTICQSWLSTTQNGHVTCAWRACVDVLRHHKYNFLKTSTSGWVIQLILS